MDDLDVIVVAYRSRDTIESLLRRVQEELRPATLTVVDNGDDGSADLAAAVGADVVRRPDNPGFGAGQNAGVRVGDAPFVLLLNPDAQPVAGGIDAGVRLLRANADVGVVQGDIVNDATGEPERSHGVELGPIHLLGRALGARRLGRYTALRSLAGRTSLRDHVERTVTEPTDVDTVAATAVLVRRDALLSIGGFDERYFLYGEDLDLCRRMRAGGWRIVAVPGEFARHVSGGSSANAWERELVWWQGTMQFARQWWSGPRRAVAVFAAVVRWFGLAVQRPSEAGRAWRTVVSPSPRRP